jgi:metal iron transporter
MNCPIRTDPIPDEGHNQNPSDMANEINTNNTLNRRRNSTHGGRNSSIHLADGSHDAIECTQVVIEDDKRGATAKEATAGARAAGGGEDGKRGWTRAYMTVRRKLVKYSKFIGPGFMVSVSYIDPGMRRSQSRGAVMLIVFHRKLCHRRSSRSFLPLPPPLHDTAL